MCYDISSELVGVLQTTIGYNPEILGGAWAKATEPASFISQEWVMPYKSKEKARVWHKLVMRERRLRLKGTIVTPVVTPRVDADGEIIPENE